jgi:hypothetical protein
MMSLCAKYPSDEYNQLLILQIFTAVSQQNCVVLLVSLVGVAVPIA